ncbi:hypothetical protein LQW54_011429 [Pestalotiopsis sp. IQ-011]
MILKSRLQQKRQNEIAPEIAPVASTVRAEIDPATATVIMIDIDTITALGNETKTVMKTAIDTNDQGTLEMRKTARRSTGATIIDTETTGITTEKRKRDHLNNSGPT